MIYHLFEVCFRKGRMRKTAAAFTAIALLFLPLNSARFSDAASVIYSDVKGAECEEAVAELTEKAIINGYEDKTFRPDHQITRAEVSKIFAALLEQNDAKVVLPDTADVSDTILYSEEAEQIGAEEIEGDGSGASDADMSDTSASSSSNSGTAASGSVSDKPDEDGEVDVEKADNAALSQQLSKDLKDTKRMQEIALALYDDLENSSWAQPYVAAASLCGIVNGYGNKTFNPSGNITYNELATMCVRAAGVEESELTGVWPANYVAAAEKLGVYKGMKEFDPKTDSGSSAATRGNTAIAVYNVLEEIQKQAEKGYSVPDSLISAVKVKPSVKLTLEEAVRIMQTEGMQAESAAMSKKSDEAIASGYKETVSSISDSLDIMNFLPLEQQYQLQQSGVTQSNLKIITLQRDFVKANIDNNYQADMNKIEQTTNQLYYGLLQAKENVTACEEALTSEKNTLELIKKKYELGAASSVEVQVQENAVDTAQDSLNQAKNTVESTEANFIMLMDLDSDTELTLVTELEKVTADLPSIADAIDSMLKNNLELKYYDYLTEVTEIQINSLRYTTSKNSSTYKEAENAYDQAQMAIKQMTENKKTSLRTAYEELAALESQISKFESTISLTETSLNLAKDKYDLGMGTLSEIESAQLTLTQAKQGLTNAIVAYNQAVANIQFDIGVGTTRISFS